MRQNTELRAFCESAKRQMEADHASKKLMDAENERLRNRLFEKSKKPNKRRDGGSRARHMTGEECKIALAQDIWKIRLAEVHKELLEGAKARQVEQQAVLKVFESAVKKIREKQKVAMREEKELRKAEDAAQRQRDKEEARRRKEEQAAHKRELKERDAQAKREAAEQERVRKAAEKVEKALQKTKEKEAKQHASRSRKRKATAIEVDALTNNEDSENRPPTPKRPRPRPRPHIRIPSPCLVPVTTGGPADIHDKEDDIETAGRPFGLEVQNQDQYSIQEVHLGVIDPSLMDQS